MGKCPWQIQIITSEIAIQLAVARAYRNERVDIITATDLEQARSQIRVFDFDLFVLDLDFNDGCGFSLLRSMTERALEAPVILLTSPGEGSRYLIRQIEQIRPKGCWHLLEKPVAPHKLSGFIERGLLEKESVCFFKPDPDSLTEAEQRLCRRFARHEAINLLPADLDKEVKPRTETAATLTDISLGGVGVTTAKPLLCGQKLNFSQKLMHQTGIVVWARTEQTGFCRAGIRFN
jgi:CheY-like chemotaxis protein